MLTGGNRLQRSHCGQGLALDKLEEGSTTGGYVTDIVTNPELVDRGQCIAAAGNAVGALSFDRLRHCSGACSKVPELENTDRAIPDDGSGAGYDF